MCTGNAGAEDGDELFVLAAASISCVRGALSEIVPAVFVKRFMLFRSTNTTTVYYSTVVSHKIDAIRSSTINRALWWSPNTVVALLTFFCMWPSSCERACDFPMGVARIIHANQIVDRACVPPTQYGWVCTACPGRHVLYAVTIIIVLLLYYYCTAAQ